MHSSNVVAPRDLLEIGAQLGHKSPAMTHRYAHLARGAAITAH
jgi:integrase